MDTPKNRTILKSPLFNWLQFYPIDNKPTVEYQAIGTLNRAKEGDVDIEHRTSPTFSRSDPL